MNNDLLLSYYVIYIIKDFTHNNVEWNETLKKTNI